MSGDVTSVQTRGGQLSYLVSEEAVADLPLNGRNYTDLAFLQPGVLSFPHRDGGSIVAHGLAASINGQDPRSNVYLLDGTLLNDFTNGPAGSAASTSLGTETVREFRVETNAYSAEFGRNSGGQINVHHEVGPERLAREPLRVPQERRARRPQLLRSRPEARLPPQPVRRHAVGAAAQGQELLLRRLRGPARAARQDDLHRRPGRGRAPGDPAGARRRHDHGAGEPRRAAVPRRVPAPERREPGRRPRGLQRSRSTRRSTRTCSRCGSTRTWAAPTSSSSATRGTTPSRRCRPTSRSSRARSSRPTSS